MKKSEAIFGVMRVPLDVLAVLAALLLSYRLREANIDLLPGVQLLEPARTLPALSFYFSTFVLPGVLVCVVLSAMFGLYTLRATLSAWSEMGRVILVVILWMALVIAWYFLVEKQLFYSRILLFHSAFFLVLFFVALRMALLLLQRALLRSGVGKVLVVSLGSVPLVETAADTLKHDVHYWYLGHLPDLEALKRVTQKQEVDLVLQTDPNPGSEATIALINYCRSHQFGYGFLPPVLADVPHQLVVDRLDLLPIIRFQPTPLDGWGRVVKRIFDILVSLFLLIVLSPVFLITALLIVIDSGFPVFYVSKRTGQNGRVQIPVLKFRSMVRNADKIKTDLLKLNHRVDGPLFKARNDPRVTRVGKFLRRWTLDELPQLWSVFFGRMSLVGPRPHLPDEVAKYSLEQRRVFAVKPGITGLAQISGRSDLKFEDEVRLDLQYIEEWSLLLDLWILWRTIFVVFGRKGAD